MSASLVQELFLRAQDLSPEERVQLAEEILATVREVDEDVDAAWDLEIERRIAEIETGTDQLVSAEEVFARLRRLPK
jgi:putative addiction module component (TIGR02574 family)